MAWNGSGKGSGSSSAERKSRNCGILSFQLQTFYLAPAFRGCLLSYFFDGRQLMVQGQKRTAGMLTRGRRQQRVCYGCALRPPAVTLHARRNRTKKKVASFKELLRTSSHHRDQFGAFSPSPGEQSCGGLCFSLAALCSADLLWGTSWSAELRHPCTTRYAWSVAQLWWMEVFKGESKQPVNALMTTRWLYGVCHRQVQPCLTSIRHPLLFYVRIKSILGVL